MLACGTGNKVRETIACTETAAMFLKLFSWGSAFLGSGVWKIVSIIASPAAPTRVFLEGVQG